MIPALLAGYVAPADSSEEVAEKAAVALARATFSTSECVRYGWYMALGIGVQGLFTLEMAVSLKSMIHWTGALLFMYGAMNHCQIAVELYDAALRGEYQSPNFSGYSNSIDSFLKLKKFCLSAPSLMLIVPLLLQFFLASQPQPNPETPQAKAQVQAEETAQERLPPNVENSMGLMQWGLIGSNLFFWFPRMRLFNLLGRLRAFTRKLFY